MRPNTRVSGMDLQWNGPRIEKAFLDAFAETNQALIPLFDREITKAKWNWPRMPAPRDIVDSGVLRQSYGQTKGELTVDHTWAVDYAIAVHEGASLGNTALPARPWTRDPLKRLPEIFGKIAKRHLGGIQ